MLMLMQLFDVNSVDSLVFALQLSHTLRMCVSACVFALLHENQRRA